MSGNSSKLDTPPNSILDDAWRAVKFILTPVASLRLTVALFFFSVVLIFVATLAQYNLNMWEVIDTYFRSWFVSVDFKVFFPKSFFPSDPQIPGRMTIPGGALLGLALAVNLAAAHLVRFKTQAKGTRLAMGTAVIALGIIVTTLIVMSGHNSSGVQVNVVDPSMRILWQLRQGLVAGLILLIGSVMVFKRRGGIVVIHLGVGLLMFGELLVGMYAVEEQMAIREGQTMAFARDTRKVEIAVVDHSPADHDDVVVIPGERLKEGKSINNDLLPFEIEVIKFLKNCELESPEEENLATAGNGLGVRIIEKRSASGAESSGEIDVAGVYVKITPKGDPDAAEVYMLSQHYGDSDILTVGSIPPKPESILVGDKFYDVSLRYKRSYKSYRVTLNDVRKEDYLGTSTPRDYSSYITLVDKERDFSKNDIRIWMNNPLRYAGETFYQSGYNADATGEITTLQIVTNTGWMIPYIACMLAFVGLFYHFAVVLARFINRTLRQSTIPVATAIDEDSTTDDKNQKSRGSRKRAGQLQTAGNTALSGSGAAAYWIPVLAAGLCLMFIASSARKKEVLHNEMQLSQFAQVPVVFGGRVKPIDTLARNTLRTVSDKQVLRVPKIDGNWKKTRRESSLVWLLDTITQADGGRDHRVFRIDNLDVLETLSLERRKGFRYSANEIAEGIEAFEAESKAARKVAADDASKLTFQQRKLLETDKRIRAYMKVQNSFLPVPIPPLPTAEQREQDPETAKQIEQLIVERLKATPRLNQALMAMEPPLVVPLSRGSGKWEPFAAAANKAVLQSFMSTGEIDPRVRQWSIILDAYSQGDAKVFNQEVAAYLKDIRANPPSDYDPQKVQFENWFNEFQPFYIGMVLYVVAFLLTILSWMGWFQPLRRAALTVILLTLAVHTFALIARMYISGRPPVTNLYSSAVFIGWASVGFGVVIEWFTKIGFGNIVSSVMGFTTLFIAHQLAFGGDTFTVLQAVLDTQFWLATHVVCITFGYAATFVAGVLAVLYILVGLFVPAITKDMLKVVGRMVYGVLCFAIFLSFIGTVLGGLWADDSWGRFWGWDPKENGALMIVLWNALILHARWGKMVGDRGVAVLAVFGNIVTAWSWFGVNELGIGLHSYGFTEGVLPALGSFALLMLGIIGLGLMPKAMWLSGREETV